MKYRPGLNFTATLFVHITVVIIHQMFQNITTKITPTQTSMPCMFIELCDPANDACLCRTNILLCDMQIILLSYKQHPTHMVLSILSKNFKMRTNSNETFLKNCWNFKKRNIQLKILEILSGKANRMEIPSKNKLKQCWLAGFCFLFYKNVIYYISFVVSEISWRKILQ